MDLTYFGGSAAAGIIGWATIFAAIIWPKMKQQPRVQQLKTLTAIHFFRYFATTLLIAGLVSRKLPCLHHPDRVRAAAAGRPFLRPEST
jgi:hypothetical protein